MSDGAFDLVVIGSGPGGYVAAIRAAQLGMRVACVEKDRTLGGTCLNVGCIPSKALLESSHRFWDAQRNMAVHGVKVGNVELDLDTMQRRKELVVKTLTDGVAGLLKKNQVERIEGMGQIDRPGEVRIRAAAGAERVVKTSRILLATGSVPSVPKGITVDEKRIVSSTGALAFSTVPKHLVVLGAGVIGVELASVWARLGARVTVLELLGRILAGVDAEISDLALKVLSRQGVEFRLGRRVQAVKVLDDHVVVEHGNAEGAIETVECDRVLVATGRKAFTEGLGCDALGVRRDAQGRIEVAAHYQSSIAGIFAIGDVIAGPMLAHKAQDEGIAAVEGMVTGHGRVNYGAIPSVVYTNPEIASVGRTEEELVAQSIPYKKGTFPFGANGRARALGQKDGMVKMLAHAESDRLLGVHILGPSAGDLIAEACVVIDFEGSAEDIARNCHAHPTLSEVMREAALAISGRQLHL